VASPHVVYSLFLPLSLFPVFSYSPLYYVSPVSPIIEHLICNYLPPIPVYKGQGQSNCSRIWGNLEPYDVICPSPPNGKDPPEL
jgi:hypothetical protein